MNQNNLKFDKKIYPNNIIHTQLNESLILVSEEMTSAESYALGFFYEIGSRDDIKELNGIAHFIEHCTFRRTSKLSSKQIASRFESLGAYANAFTTQESTCFYVRALKKNFSPVFKLLNEITLDTQFNPVDVDKERQIILEEIKSYEDDPEESIFDYGDKTIFGEHPMGSSILGTELSLNNINIENLKEYHERNYKKGKLIISYVGPHSHKFLLDTITKYLLKTVVQEYYPVNRIKPDILPSAIIEIEKPVSQSHILIGSRIPGFDEDNKYVLPLFNILFGDGMSSRLYQNLRDKYGIAYSIYSTLQVHSDSGVLYVYAASDTKKLKKTQTLIIEEIDKIINSKIGGKELHRAKEQLKSSLIMEQESLSARMQSIAKNIIMKTEFEEMKETIKSIDNIKAEEIRNYVAQYFNPNSISIVRMIGTG
jgi:predicted Zn-dependent peptidase